MPEVTDDLEKLLSDVRKTINDNKQFLQVLVDDATDVSEDPDNTGDEGEAGDEFEEL
jgi:hypothetical protein